MITKERMLELIKTGGNVFYYKKGKPIMINLIGVECIFDNELLVWDKRYELKYLDEKI